MTETNSSLAALIDEAAIGRYLAEQVPGDGAVSVERHQAGHSNETFFITRGAEEWVLRRPPLGAFLPSAHDVGREYTVLSGLQGTGVRVPRTFAMCTDESLIGAPFYLMERKHGVVIRDSLPEWAVADHEARARIGDELVDALVELHSVDLEACGLENFGKTSGYLERQLRRWTGQMELTLPLTREVPDLVTLGDWLRDNRPTSQRTTLVHGDYKLDNVMFASDGPRLISIFDWEMSTLGDPLADLGWMISFWREADDPEDEIFRDASGVTEQAGFKSRAELIGRYERAMGLEVETLDWYVVLAVWKLAILLEGSYARHLAGMTDDPFFERMEQGVPALAARALEIANP